LKGTASSHDCPIQWDAAASSPYASNGQGLYGIDMQTGAEGPVEDGAYPTPDDLWAKTFTAANAWRARAERARLAITTYFDNRQQAVLDFGLSQYVAVGVDELATEKLSPLLRLKYNNAVADAVADLGPPAMNHFLAGG
jgi:hypothetical protein